MTKEFIKTIDRLYRSYEALGEAFNDLTPFAVCSARFETGSLHHIMGLRCKEVGEADFRSSFDTSVEYGGSARLVIEENR